MLRHVPAIDDPRALVTAATRDDAAVYRVSDDRAIVATVDFFTPIVDDPYTFGVIAAANALSDLYAMGATPRFGLNLVAWPREPDVLALLDDAVRGACEAAARAGAVILGGHSIDDREPKLGMVAFGEVFLDRLLTIEGAAPGDRLVLTKPIGTGILSTALKREWIGEPDMQDALDAMMTLNADAADAMAATPGIHAVTDVTGFGLLGHLHNLLTAGRVSARIWADRVPTFAGVPELEARGAVPGGTTRNLEAAGDYATWTADLPAATRTVLCDAQTSGGLLVAVAPEAVDRFVDELTRRSAPAAAVVGEIVAGDAAGIEVVTDGG